MGLRIDSTGAVAQHPFCSINDALDAGVLICVPDKIGFRQCLKQFHGITVPTTHTPKTPHAVSRGTILLGSNRSDLR